jgi:hypothetical protein
VPGTQLIDTLLALAESCGDRDAAADKNEEDEAEEGDDDDGDKAAKDGDKDGKVAVEFGDEALLLLRALAAQDGDVKEKLAGQSEILGSRCTIM